MANSLDANGLTINSLPELTTQLETDFKDIYGSDSNLDSDTPDGQMINSFCQSTEDTLELIKQVNAGFDPDQAVGRVLDQRVAINGIQRQAGTYTETNITIVTSKALTLYGLNQTVEDPYTVQDNAGNKWILKTTQTPAGAGTYVYVFRAENAGAVTTTLNTITTPVSIVLGVTSINNPTTYSVLGINEELDSELKIRRRKSVAISAKGYNDAMTAMLENITGVTYAKVYENTTDTQDSDSIPAHGMWAIVEGGTDAQIAAAIYAKRSGGHAMKGSEQYTITQDDGSPFTIFWDEVASETLYIKFSASSLDGVNPPNTALILSRLPVLFTTGIYDRVNANELSTLVQSIDPNCLVSFPSNTGFCLSSGGAYTLSLRNSAKNKRFAISSGNISITVV